MSFARFSPGASPKSIGAMIEVLTNGLLDRKKGSKIWHVAWYLLHKLKKN